VEYPCERLMDIAQRKRKQKGGDYWWQDESGPTGEAIETRRGCEEEGGGNPAREGAYRSPKSFRLS